MHSQDPFRKLSSQTYTICLRCLRCSLLIPLRNGRMAGPTCDESQEEYEQRGCEYEQCGCQCQADSIRWVPSQVVLLRIGLVKQIAISRKRR